MHGQIKDGLVLVLLRLATLRRSAVEARPLEIEVGRSHVDHVAASLKVAVAIDTKGGAVVEGVDVRLLAEFNAQAASLVVGVGKEQPDEERLEL